MQMEENDVRNELSIISKQNNLPIISGVSNAFNELRNGEVITIQISEKAIYRGKIKTKDAKSESII